ncbi:MAG TPA: CHAT domain-containing protein [Thermoanaerobaculia bacterium]|nr:CHAT domain-containing protein [Thermoanaerobaculia bacterium]
MTVALAAAVAVAPRPSNSSEEKTYREVAAAIDRGDFDRANVLIGGANRQFAGSKSCWMWGIHILGATQPTFGSRWSAAKLILDPPPPAGCHASEPAVRRLVLRAWVADSNNKPFASDIEAAARVAAAHGPASQVLVDWMQASILSNHTKYSQASDIAQRALRLAQANGLEVEEAKLDATLARVMTYYERLDEAVTLNERALALCRKHHLDIQAGRITGNLSWAYMNLGELALADQRADEAVQLATKLGSKSDLIAPLMIRGNIRRSQRQYDEATPFFESAVKVARDIKDRRTGECLANLAVLALDKHDYDTAESVNNEALGFKYDAQDDTSLLRSRLIQGQIAAGRNQVAEAETIYKSVEAAPNAPPSTQWEAKGRLGKLYAATGRAGLAEQYFRKVFRTADAVRSEVREELKLGFASNVSEFNDAYIDMLVRLGRVEQALAVADDARARTLTEGLGIPAQARARDAKRIAAGARAVILSYRFAVGRSYLWVITPKTIELLPLPDGDEIDKAVKAYQQQILEPDSSPTLLADGAGAKLYQRLVKPAEPWLARAQRVVIIPDGALSAFNMEALVVSTPKPHYWIQDATIFTASSLQFLGGARGKVGTRSVLLVGNAVSCDKEFPALTNADKEMSLIALHFDCARKIQQKEATPAAYKATAVGTFDVVHFVAHGVANRVQPLQSAVVLSCGRDGAYKLYARDIMKQPLGAQLVTVSSCRSAGNRAYSGEGLVGLAWAFLRAGAQQVVAALWDVNDRATPKLMDDFYRQLREGKDAPTALRAAKLNLIARGGIAERPLYWAPFVLYSGAPDGSRRVLSPHHAYAR